MKIHILTAGCAVGLFAAVSFAAFGQPSHGQLAQPYAGMQSRAIKSLSEQQEADLKAGRGMGLAFVAELNGYPGPSHLLELADQLNLSAGQRSALKKMFDNMKVETIPIGENLIAQEAKLNRLFAEHGVSEQNLKASTAEIGETQSTLRNAHLKYHLQTRGILNPEQIKHYAELRGYGGEHQPHN